MACAFCGPSLGSNQKCPDHGTSNFARDDDADDPSDGAAADNLTAAAHYAEAATEPDAITLHAAEHLCSRCAMVDLCRFAPEASDLLIVVSRCRAFTHAE